MEILEHILNASKIFQMQDSSKYMYEPKVKLSLPRSSIPDAVLSIRFEIGVSLLLAPAGADKRGPKVPFPLVENAIIQLAIRESTLRSSGGSRVLLKPLPWFYQMFTVSSIRTYQMK